MSRRLRVERVVGDAGYGHGWIVLGVEGGEALGWRSTWADAMRLARFILGISEQIAPVSAEVELYCDHGSWTGAEGPVALLGRWPILWKCDVCGLVEAHR